MDQSIVKPDIFSRDLDNNLELLAIELENITKQIVDGTVFGISKQEVLEMPDVVNSPSSYFGKRYNLFQLDLDGIKSLHKAVRDMTQEALDRYGSEKTVDDYAVASWFNLHKRSSKQPFHDHFAGNEENPVFHGYYCVKAEPSATHYLINGDKESPMDIINKNNRAILLKNGHPHGIGNWPYDTNRITIAYDVVPLSLASEDRTWVKLSI